MRLISLISIDSTNTHAQRLIREGLTENSLIYSSEQTKGRGQRGKDWLSRPGDGIYCSYVYFQQHLLVSHQFVFNMAMASAVAEFVSSKISGEVKIKWPNDILVNKKKIAGLLIENSIKGESITVSVVGIGVNLNQIGELQDFETKGTSMKAETGDNYPYETAVFELANFVKIAKAEFDSGDYESIIRKYHSYLYQNQKEIQLRLADNSNTTVILEGVNADGSLSVLAEGKSINYFHPQARICVTHS